ncbi:MAG: hypothetical protein WCK49_01225 [Myxococcaceae bacterium]
MKILAALLIASSLSASVPTELTQTDFISSVMRYVYLWSDSPESSDKIWVRLVKIKTDKGDHSQFAEMWLPAQKLLIDLKKADYQVPERNLTMKDNGFKIRLVKHLPKAPAPISGWKVLALPSKKNLTQKHVFPDETAKIQLKKALGSYPDTGEACYIAPVSQVSNELWVFCESPKLALRFSTDVKLTDPLSVHAIDLNKEGIPPEWAGRLLYNTVILGEKLDLD